MLYPLILAILVSIYAVYTMPEVKGWLGELIVRVVLSLIPDNHITMNNIYIPAYDGMYTQIDHIVISSCGIIVIETKNYSGKISGSSRKKYWTAIRAGESGKVYNPIRQNAYHIKMLKDNCPELGSINIYSVICLLSGAKADVKTNIPITNPIGLIRIIKKLNISNKYNLEQINNLAGMIREITVDSSTAAQKHKKMIAARKERFRKGFCPRCNAKLVKRRSVRGEYLICSNYPVCKFRASNRM